MLRSPHGGPSLRALAQEPSRPCADASRLSPFCKGWWRPATPTRPQRVLSGDGASVSVASLEDAMIRGSFGGRSSKEKLFMLHHTHFPLGQCPSTCTSHTMHLHM